MAGQYYQQQYQSYQQPSATYGTYGQYMQQNVFNQNAWQCFGFSSGDELRDQFMFRVNSNPINMQHQAIQSEDLVWVMNNVGAIRNYFKINWSREMCTIMLAMLDRSKDGFMQWEEFNELQQCLVQWHRLFHQYDRDASGYAESNEIIQCINNTFGYRMTPEVIEVLLKRYSYVQLDPRTGQPSCKMAFDDFVAMSVRLRSLTDAFRARDKQQHGGAETGDSGFGYHDFLRCVMCL